MSTLRIGDIIELVTAAEAAGESAIVVSIVANRSDLSVSPGTRMLVKSDGSRQGTVHPIADETLAADAGNSLRLRRSEVRSYITDRDSLRFVGVQGGTIDIFFEVLARPIRLIIVGAGHIALPLCRVGVLLGYRVTVVDDRKEFANAERFPEASNIEVGPYKATLSGLHIDDDTCVVLVTRGHVHDRACLEYLSETSARYVGMIGSKKRVRTVMKQMRDAGFDSEFFERVYAPVGIDIGAQTPEEIAIAIGAEIVQVLRGGGASHLSRKKRVSD